MKFKSFMVVYISRKQPRLAKVIFRSDISASYRNQCNSDVVFVCIT